MPAEAGIHCEQGDAVLMNKGFRVGRAAALAFVMTAAFPRLAAAVDFAVTGTATINGNAAVLPAGGKFANSGYDLVTGAIANGKFTFPQTTSTSSSGGVTYVVKYQLSQTDTSSGQVASDGVAALTDASLKLTVVSATANGFPIPIGACAFQPIVAGLSGTGSATGLDLADSQFDIPEAPPGDCGSFRDQINAAFAGSSNSIEIHLDGDFTPPSDMDRIFDDGFE